jgi:hypothetical protein
MGLSAGFGVTRHCGPPRRFPAISPVGFQVVTQCESWKFLLAHSPSQNYYRDHAAGDEQAKRYGGRDNFKPVVSCEECKRGKNNFPKIIFSMKAFG